jgi:hypothetical protein
MRHHHPSAHFLGLFRSPQPGFFGQGDRGRGLLKVPDNLRMFHFSGFRNWSAPNLSFARAMLSQVFLLCRLLLSPGKTVSKGNILLLLTLFVHDTFWLIEVKRQDIE